MSAKISQKYVKPVYTTAAHPRVAPPIKLVPAREWLAHTMQIIPKFIIFKTNFYIILTIFLLIDNPINKPKSGSVLASVSNRNQYGGADLRTSFSLHSEEYC